MFMDPDLPCQEAERTTFSQPETQRARSDKWNGPSCDGGLDQDGPWPHWRSQAGTFEDWKRPLKKHIQNNTRTKNRKYIDTYVMSYEYMNAYSNYIKWLYCLKCFGPRKCFLRQVTLFVACLACTILGRPKPLGRPPVVSPGCLRLKSP